MLVFKKGNSPMSALFARSTFMNLKHRLVFHMYTCLVCTKHMCENPARVSVAIASRVCACVCSMSECENAMTLICFLGKEWRIPSWFIAHRSSSSHAGIHAMGLCTRARAGHIGGHACEARCLHVPGSLLLPVMFFYVAEATGVILFIAWKLFGYALRYFEMSKTLYYVL